MVWRENEKSVDSRFLKIVWEIRSLRTRACNAKFFERGVEHRRKTVKLVKVFIYFSQLDHFEIFRQFFFYVQHLFQKTF
jgi:hypothetical protein